MDIKKPLNLVLIRFSGYFRTFPSLHLVEAAGLEPASKKPTSYIVASDDAL